MPDGGFFMSGWTWEMVAERLKEAVQTARALATDRPARFKCQWPHAPHDKLDQWFAYGHYGDPEFRYLLERRRPDLKVTPEPGAFGRMDEAFAWLPWLSREERTLTQAVLRGVRYSTIARKMGVNRSTAMRRFRANCRHIASRLNNSLTPATNATKM